MEMSLSWCFVLAPPMSIDKTWPMSNENAAEENKTLPGGSSVPPRVRMAEQSPLCVCRAARPGLCLHHPLGSGGGRAGVNVCNSAELCCVFWWIRLLLGCDVGARLLLHNAPRT